MPTPPIGFSTAGSIPIDIAALQGWQKMKADWAKVRAEETAARSEHPAKAQE
jgi:hypothetical protein